MSVRGDVKCNVSAKGGWIGEKSGRHAAMNDAMYIVQIGKTFKDSEGDLRDDLDIDGAYSFVDAV